jgi:hypothetical protein
VTDRKRRSGWRGALTARQGLEDTLAARPLQRNSWHQHKTASGDQTAYGSRPALGSNPLGRRVAGHNPQPEASLQRRDIILYCNFNNIRVRGFILTGAPGTTQDLGKSEALASSRAEPLNYSMTSSALARSVAGIASPSAFAVFRLMTSSYRVGACTGRSAGFSPRRMRST